MLITIHTPTNALQNSLDFYSKLGFRQISENPIIFTDGKALVEINPDRYARAGIKLYGKEWDDAVDKLKALTLVTAIPGGHLCGDLSGAYIYIMRDSPPIQWEPEEKCFGVPGNFAGLSLETTDIERSAPVYEVLGFEKTGGSPEGGYISYSLDSFTVTLMRPLSCPHLFFNPSMTYFNGGKNLPVIEKIRALSIPIAEEITYFNKEGIVDNVIVRDPGGYGFFIFND